MNRKLMKGRPFFVFVVLIYFASCMDSPDIPSREEQLQVDIAAIDAYLEANNITAVEHTSGLRYVIHTEGTGSTITVDSCVTTNYKGMLMSNGSKFDENTNISFPLAYLIEGWQVGLSLMQQGDSVTLYIPSVMGYGYYGAPPTIPGNSNLIFGIKVVDVGRTYKNEGAKGKCE